MSLPELAKECLPLSVTGGIRHDQQRRKGSTVNSFYVCKDKLSTIAKVILKHAVQQNNSKHVHR